MSWESALRHVAAMDPPGRRSITSGEAQAALAEIERLRGVLALIESGHVPSPVSDLYPEDNVRFCELDDERWPCSAITGGNADEEDR